MRYLLLFLFTMFCFLLQAQIKDSTASRNDLYRSEERETSFYGLRLFTENDFLSPLAPNLDDNYTGGLKVEFITNRLSALRLGYVFRKRNWDIVAQNISYGLIVFTPQDLAKPTIITTDRPYASYNFVSTGSSFVKRSNYKTILGYEVFVGQIGSEAGKNFQTKIHREHWFGTKRPIPQGWQYQIANGGALALNLRLFSETNVFETGKSNKFKLVQGSWVRELNLGQYLVNYSQAFRFSLFNINRIFGKSFSIPQPVLPTIIQNSTGASSTRKTNFNFNLYATPRVRLVAHNATLTGKLLSAPSVYTISPSNVSHVLFEYDMGMNLRYRFIDAGFNLSGRSKEFKYQQQSFQNWGGVYVAFIYRK